MNKSRWKKQSDAMKAAWARRKAREIETDLIKGDNVNHPPHYNKGRFETIEVIEDIVQFYPPTEAVLVANVIKYIARAPHKSDKIEALRKAQWYLNRLVEKASA